MFRSLTRVTSHRLFPNFLDEYKLQTYLTCGSFPITSYF